MSSPPTPATATSVEPFSFTRQTVVFLGILAAFELATILVFPLIAVVFGAIAALLLAIVWIKAGIRTRRWLWWNPAAVPLTQAEGAFALSAVLLCSVGILLTGHEAIRFASGERDVLTGYAFRHMISREPSSRPVGTRAVKYSDPDMQQRLKDELAKAGIPHTVETKDGEEYVVWTPEHNAAVEEIQRRLHEQPSADAGPARNVHFGNPTTQQAFKDWLTERGIAYEIKTIGGKEFVLWKEGPEDLSAQFMKDHSPPCDKETAASASGKVGPTRC